jgi:hypothetical protein
MTANEKGFRADEHEGTSLRNRRRRPLYNKMLGIFMSSGMGTPQVVGVEISGGIDTGSGAGRGKRWASGRNVLPNQMIIFCVAQGCG